MKWNFKMALKLRPLVLHVLFIYGKSSVYSLNNEFKREVTKLQNLLNSNLLLRRKIFNNYLLQKYQKFQDCKTK